MLVADVLPGNAPSTTLHDDTLHDTELAQNLDDEHARALHVRQVDCAKEGCSECFAELYKTYLDLIYNFIFHRVGRRAVVAEDLCSEVFLKALRKLDTFTWMGRDFGAWLVTIARHLIADYFKSSKFRLEVTSGEMLDANEVEASPEDHVLEALSHTELNDAVRRLNPRQGECIKLRFLKGLSVAETAMRMDMNEGAVKTLQYRAVRTLGKFLAEEGLDARDMLRTS